MYNKYIPNCNFSISEKYDIVGNLLKPGETAKSYSDDESETKKSL